MKRENITPKIIELAREIAEYWRMEIYVGCWILDGGMIKLVFLKRGQFIYVIVGEEKRMTVSGNVIPIPSISDCLEKLRELKLRYIFHAWELDEILVSLISDEDSTVIIDQLKSDNLYEALLSALLEVLKEK